MSTFRARATGFKWGETEKGEPQIAVTFKVYEEGPSVGKSYTWYGYFTDKTAERTVRSLRYCGWQGVDLANVSGLESNEVEIVVEPDTYNGVTKDKVQWVNEVGGVALKKPMSNESLKAFAAKMKGLVVSTVPRAPATAPKAPPVPPKAPPPPGEPGADTEEDGIPF